MAKLLVLNDLHEEHGPLEPVPPARLGAAPDAVLIAGDLSWTGGMTFTMRRFREAYGVPVIAVEGNHDLWRMTASERARTPPELRAVMRRFDPSGALRLVEHVRAFNDEMLAAMNAEDAPPMRILRGGESFIVGDSRIVGATLWTDYAAGSPIRSDAMREARLVMRDHRMMMTAADGPARAVTPEDLLAWHEADRAGLVAALREPFDGPTVVMTHHVPDPSLIDEERFPRSPVTGAFAASMMDEIRGLAVDAWLYGHTHAGLEADVRTRHGHVSFLTNPRGAPGERFVPFDPGRVIDAAAPRLEADVCGTASATPCDAA